MQPNNIPSKIRLTLERVTADTDPDVLAVIAVRLKLDKIPAYARFNWNGTLQPWQCRKIFAEIDKLDVWYHAKGTGFACHLTVREYSDKWLRGIGAR